MKEQHMKNLKTSLEWLVQAVIAYSLLTYIMEMEMSTGETSLSGNPFWLWSERFVAMFFTVEYAVRWYLSKDWKYPLRLVAIIDLLAVLPFYIGFLIDLRALRIIRALRILRLLKFYRYHQSLQFIIQSFKRAIPNLVAVGYLVLVFILFSSTFMFEMERHEETKMFTSFFDATWWSIVTMTTVGYGDLYPKTPAGRVVGVITILFGIAVFSMFVSVLQEAIAGQSDASNQDILSRLDHQDELLSKIAERMSISTNQLEEAFDVPRAPEEEAVTL